MHGQLSRGSFATVACGGWALSWRPMGEEAAMALTISREQRDALYELVVDHLTSIGDVWIEFQNRDLVTAKRQAERIRVASQGR
jgi:hypothetical protein